MRPPTLRHQHGIALLEALIAFLILALGMSAIARLQFQLRFDAEIARQRSEAVRLAQQEIESLRAFDTLSATAGATSFDAIASAVQTVDAPAARGATTSYRVMRDVAAAGTLPAKALRVAVSWTDRRGDVQRIALGTLLAGIAPASSGALGLRRGGAIGAGPHGRSVRIPLAAHDLGDGRSAFKPVENGSVALLFDNASGRLIGRCTGVAANTPTGALTTPKLRDCDARPGHLVSGVVRFASGNPPDPANANDRPRDLTIAVTATGTPFPIPPACDTDPIATPSGERFVAFYCVVYPPAAGTWSARITLQPIGWTIGTGAADRRVCRYGTDLDASIASGLTHQNFLVIPGPAACPAGPAIRVAGNNGDVYVDLGTVPHPP